ncbi:MAG TPA: hypothetical protein HA341_05590 [Halobacteria archaeon]|jgi:uncharacterized OB-fold protein|nr:hypothetical protein [Halobacteria archaeon]HIH78378.1 hypothetical protein [Halobacteria archaeon]
MSFYPERRFSCPYCGSKNIKKTDIPDKGMIVSYAIKDGNIIVVVELTDGCRLVSVFDQSRLEKMAKREIIGTVVEIYLDTMTGIIRSRLIDSKL